MFISRFDREASRTEAEAIMLEAACLVFKCRYDEMKLNYCIAVELRTAASCAR
jgi:hypothetical protein